jgi:hypothetical protein
MFRGVVLQFEPVLLTAIPPRIDNRELRFLFFWPLHLGSAFINALRQRHSGALAILMYYATILVVAEARYWFLQTGWGERLIRECLDELDEDWIPAVPWPGKLISKSICATITDACLVSYSLPHEPQHDL